MYCIYNINIETFSKQFIQDSDAIVQDWPHTHIRYQ